jgi:hypothetical protein
MNDTVVSERFIKGLRNIAESRPEQAEEMFPANGVVLKAYRAGALMGGVTLAQTLCEMLGVVYNDNLGNDGLNNLMEKDND